MIAFTVAAAALPAAQPSPALAQEWQRTANWRHVRSYDWNRVEPGYTGYYPDRYYRPGPVYVMRRGDRIIGAMTGAIIVGEATARPVWSLEPRLAQSSETSCGSADHGH